MTTEPEKETRWRELAEKNWSKSTTKVRKVHNDFLKSEIWDALEKEGFELRSLLVLESLQLLEQYLWPGYDDVSSNVHALLVALMVSVKRREGLPVWDIFSTKTEAFSLFFRRILAMSVDNSLNIALRNHLLTFVIGAFQSLDNDMVRKECAPLVSIGIWHHVVSDSARESLFDENPQLRKIWRASGRRFEAADDAGKAKLSFDRSWLYTLIIGFINYINSAEALDVATLAYCERFLEFLTDLEGQLPTRRYVNALIQDLNLLAIIRVSLCYNRRSHGLFQDLFYLFRLFVCFSVNDQTGEQRSDQEVYELHCARLAKLQRIALKEFKSKLLVLALSNYGGIDKRSELEGQLAPLTDAELHQFCTSVGLRSTYSSSVNFEISRALLLEILVTHHERRKTFREMIKDTSVLPTEDDLYEPSLLRNETFDGSRSLAIPKLNLQYLTVGDFLWRSFVLYRCESFFEIRSDLEETIKRLQPMSVPTGGGVRFDGLSKMAIPISKPGILEVGPLKIGYDVPAHVRAEITLDVAGLADNVRLEWESLRPQDVIFLMAVKPEKDSLGVNGHSSELDKRNPALKAVRAAEIVQLLDDGGRAIRETARDQEGGYRRPRLRRIIVNIDPFAYSLDEEKKEKTKYDVYEHINLVVRRRGRENNFKRILESIKHLTLSDVSVPSWLQDVFLGFGDPSTASYNKLENRLKSLDLRDTFIDWSHLVESLPEKTIEAEKDVSGGFGPPYVLETQPKEEMADDRPAKKRRRDNKEPETTVKEAIKVSTYQPPNMGPYVSDKPRTNHIRFTPAQTEAIISGTQPGLTVIVGPPGTGKTDVATQIICNIYHDFPQQRTLMVAHSNQALNQLFQKITRLDIDARHLLRLGHGEEDLETDTNYGKQGRVESFLDNRTWYLAEVDRMAANLGAPGAHGNSCETADYFRLVYVKPAWIKFWDSAKSSGFDDNTIRSAFPFYPYFSNAPQPLLPSGASSEELVEIVKGCQRYMDKIFSELEDIRPFEILRNPRERANYLLMKEARIIAMTTTHAAMRRQEIADLGFRYDNVIMEEAAQITEIENFIPFALQRPRDGDLPLQRIVLCGDHLQNSPIVQNLAFRQYANLEQSLFQRLVRLGVPAIHLDRQGRARPSLAALYKWRYERLDDLPSVLQGPEYRRANAGFQYDYQFIDVPDYKGRGEMQPSPHFIQNLGEAEYAVAIYQYMRLLGYPASKISILTTYAGQRALIRDVLSHRCMRNKIFGLPRIVTTVDKYQGEQNDCKILPCSLLRQLR